MSALGVSSFACGRVAGPAAASPRTAFLRQAAWGLGKAMALVAATGVALAAAAMMVDPSASGNESSSARTPWVEVHHPIELYELSGTEFAKLPSGYTARRHVTGGGREDVLRFGDLDGAEGYLELSLYRTGREAGTPPTFEADLGRLGRESGLSLARTGRPTMLATRFGPFQAADVRLVRAGAPAPCLGFRGVPVEGAILRIAGFACGAAPRPVGRDALGCIIVRIDLDSAGEDVALQKVFVEAERRRGPDCAPAPLTAAGVKATWLDADAGLPPFKGPLVAIRR